MTTEIQQLGHTSGRVSTSDDLDLLFGVKDPILSDDLMFGMEGLGDGQNCEISFTNTFELTDTEFLEGLMKAQDAEQNLQSVPSPDSQARSPLNSDSGISDNDLRSPASSHEGEGSYTHLDLSHHGVMLESLDMSSILMGDDAMLATEGVPIVSSTVDNSDSCSDSVFPSSLSSSPTNSSSNLLPFTQKDVTTISFSAFSTDSSKPMLVLTDEEERLLKDMNVVIPRDVSLTKTEERHLKTVRRKIRNKASAMESRRKKKDYVDGLEQRVTQCTKHNRELLKKMDKLENENQSLMSQLRRLQSLVAKTTSKTAQAGTCVMVLLMSFALLVAPRYTRLGDDPGSLGSLTSKGGSRSLLHVEEPMTDLPMDADLAQSHSPKIFARALADDTSPIPDEEEAQMVDVQMKQMPGQIYDNAVNVPLVNNQSEIIVELDTQMQVAGDEVQEETGDYTTTHMKRKIHVVNDEM